jgi:uncharacterized protein (DUF362 family)
MIEFLREEISPTINISLVESDASAMKFKHAVKILGYKKMAEKYDVNLVNLSEDDAEKTQVKAGNQSFDLMIPNTIKEADIKINVPKIKYTMDPIKLTCALKNIFGCNPYPKKFQLHKRLGEFIVAINKAIKFDLCIVDGNIVSGVKPQRLGLVMAGEDPVAIDSATAEIVGLNPRNIEYLRLAEKENLGNMNYNQVGKPIKKYMDKYPRRKLKNKFLSLGYKTVILMGLGKRLGLE